MGIQRVRAADDFVNFVSGQLAKGEIRSDCAPVFIENAESNGGFSDEALEPQLALP